MNLYAAQSWEDDTLFDHEFNAPDDETAQKIADSRGWELLGEVVYQEICPEELLENIIDSLKTETVH